MEIELTEMTCPACAEKGEMSLQAECAEDDPQLIDLVITCGSCWARFNEFPCIDEMDQLD